MTKQVPLANRNPQRFTVSLAESLTLRAFIKPVTFTFKLWASWQLTVGTKRVIARLLQTDEGQQERAAVAKFSDQKARGK